PETKRLSDHGCTSIGLYVIAKYPTRAAMVTTSPSAIARRGRSSVVPIKNGRISHGAETCAAVDVQEPSHDRVPTYWSTAPNARPSSAASAKDIGRMIAAALSSRCCDDVTNV